MQSIHLTNTDAFAVRRAMAKMDLSNVHMSPALKLLMSMFDLSKTEDYKRFTQLVSQDATLLQQVMMIDPMAESETKFINANRLKEITTPEYILTNFPIYHRAMNALVGASGGGKSFVSLMISAELAVNIKTGSVGYLAAEGLSGYSGRWEAWKKHHKQDSDRLIFYPEPVNMMNKESMQDFIEDAGKNDVCFIVIDTVARCMIGGDENSTKDMGMFISNVDDMMRELNCGVLLVHHTGKDGSMRGSSALYAACESVLFLNRNDEIVTIHNQHDKGGKNKHQKEMPSKTYKFISVEVEIKDEIAQSAVLVSSNQVDDSIEHNGLNENQQIIFDLVETHKSMTPKQIIEATELSSSTVYYNLGKLVDANYLAVSNGQYEIPDIFQDSNPIG